MRSPLLAGLLAALALAAPAAAMPIDKTPAATTRQDLRSPDTRDAARQDLPSPAASDAAPPPATTPTPAPSDDGGVPWALVGGGLVALCAGGVAARRRRVRVAV